MRITIQAVKAVKAVKCNPRREVKRKTAFFWFGPRSTAGSAVAIIDPVSPDLRSATRDV